MILTKPEVHDRVVRHVANEMRMAELDDVISEREKEKRVLSSDNEELRKELKEYVKANGEFYVNALGSTILVSIDSGYSSEPIRINKLNKLL